MGKLNNYKVSFEIEVDGLSPKQAAIKVQDWLRDQESNYTFTVQDANTNKIVSVDLEEEESSMVLDVVDYSPLIVS